MRREPQLATICSSDCMMRRLRAPDSPLSLRGWTILDHPAHQTACEGCGPPDSGVWATDSPLTPRRCWAILDHPGARAAAARVAAVVAAPHHRPGRGRLVLRARLRLVRHRHAHLRDAAGPSLLSNIPSAPFSCACPASGPLQHPSAPASAASASASTAGHAYTPHACPHTCVLCTHTSLPPRSVSPSAPVPLFPLRYPSSHSKAPPLPASCFCPASDPPQLQGMHARPNARLSMRPLHAYLPLAAALARRRSRRASSTESRAPPRCTSTPMRTSGRPTRTGTPRAAETTSGSSGTTARSKWPAWRRHVSGHHLAARCCAPGLGEEATARQIPAARNCRSGATLRAFLLVDAGLAASDHPPGTTRARASRRRRCGRRC